MVRALLAGTKTQTRRVVKDAPEAATKLRLSHGSGGYLQCFIGELIDAPETDPKAWCPVIGEHGCETPVRCPYGQPGDRLWVRETLRRTAGVWDYAADARPIRETYPESLSQPLPNRDHVVSIHMPRWASRILLEITDVRVQRLQEISEEDARAEGVERNTLLPELWKPEHGWINYAYPRDYDGEDYEACETARDGFRSLWESINGAGSWDAHPWVWALTFKRVEAAHV